MNIIVTGASRGIGYELVKLFSRDSAHSIIAVARNAEKLNQLQTECLSKNSNAQIAVLPCDLGDTEQVENLVIHVLKQFQQVDVLINNAGAIVNKPFANITQDDVEKVFRVNVFSVIQLIQKMLPVMNTQQKSHIVNISSMGGFQGSVKFSGLSAYSSSKAALACLTECLAEEYKEKNIAFNCLTIGAAQTEMLNEAFPGYKAPLSASEMAGFISDFSLKAHHYINGKIIPVSLSTP